MSLRHGRININCLNKTSARTEQVLKHTHTLESQRSQTHTHKKHKHKRYLSFQVNECVSEWQCSWCVYVVSLTHSHTHTQAFCLSGVSGYPLLSLSLSVNLSLSQTICGVERRSVRLEVQLVKECLLSAC